MLSSSSILYGKMEQITGDKYAYENLKGLEGILIGQSQGRNVNYHGINPAHMGEYLFSERNEAYVGQAITKNGLGEIVIRPMNKSKELWDIISWNENIKQDISDRDLYLVSENDYSFLFSDKR